MADKGFLEDLGVGSVDERALARQARQGQRDNFRALGMGARRGLGGIAGGVAGLVSGKQYGDSEKGGRSFGGFLSNAVAGANTMEDFDAAQAAGISIEDLYARRNIRKELGGIKQREGEDAYDYRERLAARAAKIAQQSGSAAQQAAALDALKQVRDERMQYQKLQVEQQERERDFSQDGIMTAFDADTGKPTSGNFTFRMQEGKKVFGLEYSENGELVFKPFNSRFSLEDPNAGTTKETPDQRMRRAFGKGHVDETRSMVQANAQAMRKIGRVTASVKTYVDAGIDEAVLGNSGKFVSWIDNGVRNIRGALGAFMPISKEKGTSAAIDKEADPEGRRGGRNGSGYSGWNAWYARATDPEDGIWTQFQLPAWAQGVSAEAQEHRAQILELAYMAARLAEPSNRGLSDKDIEAALARIAGDTSNPQQLLRRFVTIAADAAYDLEDRLDSYKQAIPGIEDDEVDSYFGGRLLQDYRKRRSQLFTDLGVTFDENDRAQFSEVVDTQFDTSGNLQTPDNVVSIEGLSPEESDAVVDGILNFDEGQGQ